MDELTQFITMPMIVFCLVIWVAVLAQRRGMEVLFPKIKKKKLWTDFFLPLGPMGTGAGLAYLLPTYAFPPIMAGSSIGRVFCGVVCGLLSGLIYRIFKKQMEEKFIKKSSDDAVKKTDTSSPDDVSPPSE